VLLHYLVKYFAIFLLTVAIGSVFVLSCCEMSECGYTTHLGQLSLAIPCECVCGVDVNECAELVGVCHCVVSVCVV